MGVQDSETPQGTPALQFDGTGDREADLFASGLQDKLNGTQLMYVPRDTRGPNALCDPWNGIIKGSNALVYYQAPGRSELHEVDHIRRARDPSHRDPGHPEWNWRSNLYSGFAAISKAPEGAQPHTLSTATSTAYARWMHFSELPPHARGVYQSVSGLQKGTKDAEQEDWLASLGVSSSTSLRAVAVQASTAAVVARQSALIADSALKETTVRGLPNVGFDRIPLKFLPGSEVPEYVWGVVRAQGNGGLIQVRMSVFAPETAQALSAGERPSPATSRQLHERLATHLELLRDSAQRQATPLERISRESRAALSGSRDPSLEQVRDWRDAAKEVNGVARRDSATHVGG